jgi:hypothetical protein
MSQSTARSLLRLIDAKARRRTLWWHAALLVVVFVLHDLSNSWDSPLAVLPRTATALYMGYVMTMMLAAYRFGSIVPYLNHDQIARDARHDAVAEPPR